MSKFNTLNDGLLECVRDIYSAESQLSKALSRMEQKATNEQLKKLFANHKKETEKQIDRLQEVSAITGRRLVGKTCKAMQGLIDEGSEALQVESANEALIDSMIAGAALRVECYEIAAYESAIGMATEVGQDEIAKILKESLAEEKEAYSKLSKLCEMELYPDTHLGEDDDIADLMNGSLAPKKRGEGSLRRARPIGAAKFAFVFALGVLLALPLPHADADSGARCGVEMPIVGEIAKGGG